MRAAYAVGTISVKCAERWAEYCARVPATLAPWQGEVVFRGKKAAELSGTQLRTDIVVLRFPDLAALQGWFALTAYQALIPLRDAAAEVTLVSYAT